MALGPRRKEIFLATKVLADTIDEAEASLSKSFRLLKTDWFDLVYYHSAGDHDVEKAMESDGVFSWLVKQKKAGKFRFLGISGHNRPARFVPLLETGEVDVLLTLVNFVDRYTYGFEERVLPVARKHKTGIVAMKVFGGARKSADRMRTPKLLPNWMWSIWPWRSATPWGRKAWPPSTWVSTTANSCGRTSNWCGTPRPSRVKSTNNSIGSAARWHSNGAPISATSRRRDQRTTKTEPLSATSRVSEERTTTFRPF